MVQPEVEPPSTSPGALFGLLWTSVSEVLGPASAATLVRRAATRAANRSPELVGLEIKRERLEYAYVVPESWKVASPGGNAALRELCVELWVLLRHLTGDVMVSRLHRNPALHGAGILPKEDGS